MNQDIRPLRCVCAWCKTVMIEGREPTSHGQCRSCSEKFRADWKAEREAMLQRLAALEPSPGREPNWQKYREDEDE